MEDKYICKIKRYKPNMQHQQVEGIRFHSNYARLYCGILFICVLTIYLMMAKENTLDVVFCWGETSLDFSWRTLLIVLLCTTVAVFMLGSMIKVKVVIGEAGVYSKKLDLLIPWEEIKTVRYILAPHAQLAGGSHVMIHNAKTIIVCRKEHKPICIYYTSALTLLAVKKFAPTIRLNLLPAILIELYHIFANGYLLWFICSTFMPGRELQIFPLCMLVVIWFIHSIIIPLTCRYWASQHWNIELTGDIREGKGVIVG